MKKTYDDGTVARMRILAGPADCGNVFGFHKPGLIPPDHFAVVADGEYANGGRGPSVVTSRLFLSREAAIAAMQGLADPPNDSVRRYAHRNLNGSDTGHGTATRQPEGDWLLEWSFGSPAGGHVCDDGPSYSAVVTSDPDEFFAERGFVRT